MIDSLNILRGISSTRISINQRKNKNWMYSMMYTNSITVGMKSNIYTNRMSMNKYALIKNIIKSHLVGKQARR